MKKTHLFPFQETCYEQYINGILTGSLQTPCFEKLKSWILSCDLALFSDKIA